MSASKQDFEQLADAELNLLLEALIDASDAIDPDLESGVLSIHFDDDTKYVVNSHRAARQIWMAAEHTAWHFDYQPNSKQWKTTEAELWAALSAVLSKKLNTPLTLRSP